MDNDIAIKVFSLPAFLGLNKVMAYKLKIYLQPHSIRNMILCEAEKQQNKLKEELRDKFFVFESGCMHKA